MKLLETHIVPKLHAPVRIQEYNIANFKTIGSKSALKKTIKKQLITINDQTATTATFLSENDCIKVYAAAMIPKKIFKLEIPVIFEDDTIAVIHKPAGFPTNGNYFKTIENALPHNLQPSASEDALQFPKPVHRLDNPTSGILIIAKTKRAQRDLYRQFEQQEITKTYQAIVIGKTLKKGEITSPVSEKKAFTDYETLQTVSSLQNEFLSHVKLHPKTGRTHQLRVHLASIQHPIVGDSLYGKEAENYKKGLFLCATSVEFTHPITKEKVIYTIQPPTKFTSFLAREERRFLKYTF
ncbi:ribosomal large subunit pseudouridine synthase D [Kordia sp. SMS9]|uniref:RluA family pseudouridine synthase n=1 Tax=Kordia sp. SMS9 TaxID=2282170 RepID=UPI000E0CF9B6|nr:RluA family pseudouridine synthase [Kordia sp. SMS9]AXG70186.1 ribosomal large subunit pseudouridine synthase D [Kordia sp. SMS9]